MKMTDNTNKQLKGNQLSFDAGIKNFKADGSDVMYALRKLSNEEKLKYELKKTIESEYSGLDISINNLSLGVKGFYPGRTVFNLEIDTRITEPVDIINLTNMPIKKSTIKQLKEDQKKHGYKQLTTMVADVLEKHYED